MNAIAFDPALWARVAQRLEQAEGPWPMEAVRLDWTWWQEQLERGQLHTLPGRVTLSRRWGWKEHRTAKFLREQRDSSGQSDRLVSRVSWSALGSPEASPRIPKAKEPRPSQVSSPTQERITPTTGRAGAHDGLAAALGETTTRNIRPSSPLDASQTPAPPLEPVRSASGSRQPSFPAFPEDLSTVTVSPLTTEQINGFTSPASQASFSENPPPAAMSGTKPAFSSLLSSLSPEQISSEREKKEEMPADSAEPHLPVVAAFLRLLKRWSGQEAPKGRAWLVRAREDVDWFLLEIATMTEAAGLDLVDVLKRWDEWLERMARSNAAKDHKRFPCNWKSSLRKQIQLRARWHEAQKGREAHGKPAEASGSPVHGPAGADAGLRRGQPGGAAGAAGGAPGDHSSRRAAEPELDVASFRAFWSSRIRTISSMEDLAARDEALARERAQRQLEDERYGGGPFLPDSADIPGGCALSGEVWDPDSL